MDARECYNETLKRLEEQITLGIKTAVLDCKIAYSEILTYKIPEYILNRFRSNGFKVDLYKFGTMPWSKNNVTKYIYTFNWDKGE